jgi:hypothetical protein
MSVALYFFGPAALMALTRKAPETWLGFGLVRVGDA